MNIQQITGHTTKKIELTLSVQLFIKSKYLWLLCLMAYQPFNAKAILLEEP